MPSDFDEKAATWDQDAAKVRRAQVVADAIRASVQLDATGRVLEYGAGTGLVSQALARHVGPITLAEPSAGMRAVVESKLASGALPSDAQVWDLDLARDPVPDVRFDLVVSVMTLHHIPDLVPVLSGFAAMLADGGHLCVVDLEKEDGAFHRSDPDFDGHHGFSRADLAAQVEAAGFRDVRFEPCHEVEKDGGTFPLFLMTCRPSSP